MLLPVLRITAVVVVILLIVGFLLYRIQENLLFFPEKLPPDYRFSFPFPFAEVSLKGENAVLSALHFKAAESKGVVLYLHGNAGSLRDWGYIAEDFLPVQYDVFIIDYRGYGKSTGRLTHEQDLLEDARLAYEYLARRYPESEIILYGRSLGSGPAAYLAQAYQPRMLLLETPYVSIVDLARIHYPFAPGFLIKYPLHTDQWLPQVACPIYFFHGTDDELIPVAASETLAQLVGRPSALVRIAGGTHNDLSTFPEYHERLVNILVGSR